MFEDIILFHDLHLLEIVEKVCFLSSSFKLHSIKKENCPLFPGIPWPLFPQAVVPGVLSIQHGARSTRHGAHQIIQRGVCRNIPLLEGAPQTTWQPGVGQLQAWCQVDLHFQHQVLLGGHHTGLLVSLGRLYTKRIALVRLSKKKLYTLNFGWLFMLFPHWYHWTIELGHFTKAMCRIWVHHFNFESNL